MGSTSLLALPLAAAGLMLIEELRVELPGQQEAQVLLHLHSGGRGAAGGLPSEPFRRYLKAYIKFRTLMGPLHSLDMNPTHFIVIDSTL